MRKLLIAPLIALLATPTFASDAATGEQIASALIGNTVKGAMSTGEAYTEFYEADGGIKGEGYTGKWSIEGDLMCFNYGEGNDCLGVILDGGTVTWLRAGVEAGDGMLSVGNPNAL